jgi:hypothetical protein
LKLKLFASPSIAGGLLYVYNKKNCHLKWQFF